MEIKKAPDSVSVTVREGLSDSYIIQDSLAAENFSFEILRDARLDIYILADGDNPGVSRSLTARLARDARLNVFFGITGPDLTRVSLDVHLDEPGALCRIDGLAVLRGSRTADTDIRMHHHAPDCASEQLVKFIVDDVARGSFSGKIIVSHGAVRTQASQTNRNLVAGPSARMHTEPQLEIYCDDVKCSHGAATGQLDERALFYMRSRGIDLPEARTMLMNAFMADVIDSVRDEDIRERIKNKVLCTM